MRFKILAVAAAMAFAGAANAANWSVDPNRDNSLNLDIGTFSSVAALSNVTVTFDFFVSNSGTWNTPASFSLGLTPGGSISAVGAGSTSGANLLDDPDSAAGSFYHYTGTFSGLTAGAYGVKVFGNDGLKKIAVTNFAANVSAVPEPETYAMMLAGLGAVGFMARRRKAG